MIPGGIRYDKFSLEVPHCKACATAITSAHNMKFVRILPPLISMGLVAAITRSPMASLATLGVVMALMAWKFPIRPGQPDAGASVGYSEKGKIVIHSKNKAWLADLQILNS